MEFDVSDEAQPGVSGITALLGVLVTAVIGYGAYQQKSAELGTALDNLIVARGQLSAAQESAAAATEAAEAAQGQLAAKEEEIGRAYQAALGDPAVRLDAARRLFEGTEDIVAQDRVLRQFARSMRENSRRSNPAVPFSTPLPSGLHEDAAFLAEKLKVLPTNVDLSNVDLHGHYWKGARLDDVLLRDADLRAVDISQGSLRRVEFLGSLLTCANLEGADVSGTDWDGADLTFANLRGVDMSEVMNLTTEQVLDSDFDEATVFPPSVDGSAWTAVPYTTPRACLQNLRTLAAPPDLTEPSPTAAPSGSAGPSPTAAPSGSAGPSPAAALSPVPSSGAVID